MNNKGQNHVDPVDNYEYTEIRIAGFGVEN
jgi:hypothetical protein